MENLELELTERPWKVTNDDEAEWIIEKCNVELVEKS